jgi:hypothetical protein
LKENETGGTCSTKRIEEKSEQILDGKPEEEHTGVYEIIILKLIFKKQVLAQDTSLC